MLGIMALLHVWTVSVFIQLILTQHCWKGADCLNTNPIIINTWGFTRATEAGWLAMNKAQSALDGIEAGCTQCEVDQCDGTVGYGGSPDESGETTLDAMIMDGRTHDVGAVADLRRVKQAASVARAVMTYTKHTLLAGDAATHILLPLPSIAYHYLVGDGAVVELLSQATKVLRDRELDPTGPLCYRFAIDMGFSQSSLTTNTSISIQKSWKKNSCQPNFRQNVLPDPTKSCGPYKPILTDSGQKQNTRYNRDVSKYNHDTIGMIAIDKTGSIAGGTSTNGATHKVPGRVGDSPIAGAGAYVEQDVGGAAATGDGDVMMRFLPSYHAVALMSAGKSPSEAAKTALIKIIKLYPSFSGAIVAVTMDGTHGAACHGFDKFPYSYMTESDKEVQMVTINCTQSMTVH